MSRIKGTQKVSTKLTRAEKQALSVEKWQMIKELVELNKEAEKVLKAMSREEVREFRRNLKKTKATVHHVGELAKQYFKISAIKLPKPPVALRLPTPIDNLFPSNQGVATSIYNNISSRPEGLAYWLTIVNWKIEYAGEKNVIQEWVQDYFDASFGYEDDGLGGWNTDYMKGGSILDEWEQAYRVIVLGEEPVYEI